MSFFFKVSILYETDDVYGVTLIFIRHIELRIEVLCELFLDALYITFVIFCSLCTVLINLSALSILLLLSP
jgi:hypothetical protein